MVKEENEGKSPLVTQFERTLPQVFIFDGDATLIQIYETNDENISIMR